jgi:P27 family predicted phage terminase small subunit
MGASGRKPLPATLIDPGKHKKSQKDIRKRKAVEKSLRGKPKLWCPSYLSADAKKEFKRLMRIYKSLEVNILSDLDITALAMYCEATAIWKEAQGEWAKYRKIIAGNPDQQKYLDKIVKTMSDQTKIINNLAELLCITPVGRAKMGIMAVKKQQGPSKLERLMSDDD